MSHNDSDIRPETVALDALIRDALDRAQSPGGRSSSTAWLFLGDGHRGFPAAVVRDCVLEPVDKLVWMVIHQAGLGTDTRAVFPSYTAIASAVNVSSTATVSRAISILRITRWLSLCARSRDASARSGGTAYALHDEPLPLADTIVLDPGYRTFLRGACGHRHARVRRVAATVAASLNKNVRLRKNFPGPVERNKAVRVPYPSDRYRAFSFSSAVLPDLSNNGAGRHTSNPGQELKSAMTRLQNLKVVEQIPKQSSRAALQNLIFPARLKPNQCAAANRHLARIPDDQRQLVLDELDGRLQAEQHGAKPVYDELQYLRCLCVAASQGAFHPNLALKVQAERDRRRRDMERLHEEAAAREREREERESRPKGTHRVEEIRKKLGLPPAPRRRLR